MYLCMYVCVDVCVRVYVYERLCKSTIPFLSSTPSSPTHTLRPPILPSLLVSQKTNLSSFFLLSHFPFQRNFRPFVIVFRSHLMFPRKNRGHPRSGEGGREGSRESTGVLLFVLVVVFMCGWMGRCVHTLHMSSGVVFSNISSSSSFSACSACKAFT